VKKKIEQNIIHFISEQNLLKSGDRVLIALSGGPDSVFALHFFNKFKLKLGIEVYAFHVNHQLRDYHSEEDKDFCRVFCSELNIPFASVKVDVKSFASINKQSIEEAARNLRYQKFDEHSKKIGATKIVTAHNLDDNTETVLLNLFRGTGLKGVVGIPIKRDNIIRPLLSTSKNEILNYLNSEGVEYRIDLTNFESDFSRNFLRNEIIPKIKEKINPKLDNNIFRFSKIVSKAEKFIKESAFEIKEKFIIKNKIGITISNLLFDDRFDNVFSDVAKLAMEENFRKSFVYDDFLKLKSLFLLQVGNRAELSNNIIAVKERDGLSLFRKKNESLRDEVQLHINNSVKIGDKIIAASIVDEKDLRFSESSNVELIDGDSITFPLTIRRWKAGDKFRPIGLNGTKKISDYLTEIKVSSSQKKEQLLLLDGEKIVWVIGNRIDESVKINSKTKRVIKLWIK